MRVTPAYENRHVTDTGDIVAKWFDDHQTHSMTDAGRTIRAAILRAVPEATENNKWQAPNFATRDDFATLSMRRPGILQIILHTGAKPKPKLAAIQVDDRGGRMRWAGHNRAIITFTSPDDVDDALPELQTLIAAWVAQLAS